MTVLQNVVEAPRDVLRLSKAEATERATPATDRAGRAAGIEVVARA